MISVLKHIKIGFDQFLFWLEEHQIGILVTIAVHLLIVSIILILKINTYAEREYKIMVDLSQIDIKNEEQQPEETPRQEETKQEFVQNLHREYNVRNIPVNVAEERAVQNIDKMVQDIKTEMNITDPKPQDQPEEVAPQEEKSLEDEARIYDNKFPINAAGERTVYKGPTTISYELSGRRHMSMPIPAYKCLGGGKVVVDIVVNPKGYVLSAEINKDRSDSEDSCLTETAKRDAIRSRFNDSPTAPAKQTGSITYIFTAQ